MRSQGPLLLFSLGVFCLAFAAWHYFARVLPKPSIANRAFATGPSVGTGQEDEHSAEAVSAAPIAPIAPAFRGSIVGKALLPDGRPAQTVLIHAMPSQPELTDTPSATTQEDGTFSIGNLPLGTYVVCARLDNMTGASRIQITNSSPISQVVLHLISGPALGGIVVNERSVPIPGALVTPIDQDSEGYDKLRPDLQTRTGSDGRFRIGSLPARQWRLLVEATDYATLCSELLDAGTTDNRLIVFEGGGIAGRVIMDETGKPLPHSRVRARRADSDFETQSETTADYDGRFSFPTMADGPHVLDLMNTTLVPTQGFPTVDVATGHTVEVVLRVREGGRIGGHVTDETTGAGIPGAVLQVAADSALSRTRTITVKDADGGYEIQGLPDGAYRLALCAAPSGYHVRRSQNDERLVTVSPGAQLNAMDFTLRRGSVLVGMAVKADGQPAPGASVQAYGEETPQDGSGRGHWYDRATTNERGEFQMTFLYPPLTVLRLTAELPTLRGELGPLTVSSENNASIRVILNQPRAGAVSGHVVDASGAGAAAELCTQVPDGTAYFVSHTGKDGAFSIVSLVPGAYVFSAAPRGRPLARPPFQNAISVQLGAGQILTGQRIVLDDEPAYTISGHITDRSGRPVSARVELSCLICNPIVRASVSSNADGYYEFTGLAEGAYDLALLPPGYGPGAVTRTNIEAGSENVDLVSGDPQIAGKVIDAQTHGPVTSFEVAVQSLSEEDPIYRSVSNVDGAFSVSAVPRRRCVLLVRATGYKAATLNLGTIAWNATDIAGVVVKLEKRAAGS